MYACVHVHVFVCVFVFVPSYSFSLYVCVCVNGAYALSDATVAEVTLHVSILSLSLSLPFLLLHSQPVTIVPNRISAANCIIVTPESFIGAVAGREAASFIQSRDVYSNDISESNSNTGMGHACVVFTIH